MSIYNNAPALSLIHISLLHVSRNDLELDSSYVRNLMVMGLPMGFQYSITAIGSVILQLSLIHISAKPNPSRLSHEVTV